MDEIRPARPGSGFLIPLEVQEEASFFFLNFVSRLALKGKSSPKDENGRWTTLNRSQADEIRPVRPGPGFLAPFSKNLSVVCPA